MSWPLAAYGLLGVALLVGFGWYERSRPDARIVALVGTLAAFAALGRIAFAAVPNVKPTSDIVLVAGFALGGGPGFAVGAIAGLSSNFFFGQGPWTPWQMAAWGATGVLGALLARGCRAGGGRRRGGEPVGERGGDRAGAVAGIGRWPLAVVCAVAGFAFTAVQDVGDWVTYSGHSLAALGAYVGQGLGFDGIYAAASFGFALAFGPALLRSIQRFARRIEVTWVPLEEANAEGGAGGGGGHRGSGDGDGDRRGAGRSPDDASVDRPRRGLVSRVVPLLVVGSLAAGGVAAGTLDAGAGRAHAAATSPAVARAVAYLRGAQNGDGGLGVAPGQPSAQLFAGWAALGLASAGVDVATLRRAASAPTLLAYVDRGAATRDVGSLERTILVVRAAGARAGSLAARLAADVSAHGSVADQVNLTAFALLALRAANLGTQAGVEARMRGWLAGEANRDGGFGFAGRGSASDADDTGAVLEALAGASDPRTARVRTRAVAFLRHDQDPDGGFPDAPGAGSNAQSTAWAVQGLLAAGVPPSSLRRGGRTPLGYLASLVGGDGAVSYARGQTQTPVWVTGEALMALTETPLPVVGHPPARGPAAAGRATRSRSAKAAAGAGTGASAVKRRGASTAAGAGTSTAAAASPTSRRGAHRGPAGSASARRRSAARSRPSTRADLARAVARMETAVGGLPAVVVARMRLGA